MFKATLPDGTIKKGNVNLTYPQAQLPHIIEPIKPGKINIMDGAKPNANELRAGQSLAKQFGYDVDHLATASSLGIHKVRTADLYVHGLGKVDVYTPEVLKTTAISRGIEKKYNQASTIFIQANIPEADMAIIASRTWGKPRAHSISTLFFQKNNDKIIRFDRPKEK
nr:hypothetical protein [uncultured Cardiobacterium sp.]